MFWGGRSSLPQLRRLHSVGTNNTPAHSRTLQWQQNDWSFVWVECYRCWYHVILTVFLFQHERDLFQLFIAERSNNWKEFPLIDVSVCVVELLEAGRRWWWRWWWWYLVLLFMLSLLVEIVFFCFSRCPNLAIPPNPCLFSHSHFAKREDSFESQSKEKPGLQPSQWSQSGRKVTSDSREERIRRFARRAWRVASRSGITACGESWSCVVLVVIGGKVAMEWLEQMCSWPWANVEKGGTAIERPSKHCVWQAYCGRLTVLHNSWDV